MYRRLRKPMRDSLVVAMDAQLTSGGEGGIEPLIVALVSALGQLEGPEKYRIVMPWKHTSWLAPYLGPNQHIVRVPASAPSRAERLKSLLGPVRPPAGRILRRIQRSSRALQPLPAMVPVSNGFHESLGADVLHLTYPLHFIQTRVPTLFGIYDLNHRHLEGFDSIHKEWREVIYPVAFEHARAVATDSDWVRNDVTAQYGVDPRKVFAVPLAPPSAILPLPAAQTLQHVRRKYKLPERFILFPALLYPHKNHLRLLDALALFRARDGLSIPLVCTGFLSPYWRTVKAHRDGLGLQEQARFLGFVPAPDVKALYHLAEALVFPSIFEGAGMPVLEGMYEGLPVVCSDIAALREYGGDAPCFFDPQNVESIAAALKRVWCEPLLRAQMRERGQARVARFTWTRTAKTYRALYRQIAGHVVTTEDRVLLQEAQHTINTHTSGLSS